MIPLDSKDKVFPKGEHFINAGSGPCFQPFDIGHENYTALINPDTAFWSLVRKDKLAETLAGGPLIDSFLEKEEELQREMEVLRFNLKPSAVYFNPTERCNLNCSYCYIPADMRRKGVHMDVDTLLKSLAKLKEYFATTMPEDRLPQVIFHGAEPLLNKSAVFEGIRAFKDDFRFGVQTNATLLDEKAIKFLTENRVSIGLSLDAPEAETALETRHKWNGKGVFNSTVTAMKRLRGYEGWSVICTMSDSNQERLSEMVEFFHAHHVPACMLNVIRCTQPGAREIRPDDNGLAQHYIQALERSNELYHETGRKIVVANFANILISILAPTARRLMCDISPCGGGRSFFALAANGDIFPCSEFIGLDTFNGGNLFKDKIEDVLKTKPFKSVTERKVEDIKPCDGCAIRHFCGASCPAEAYEMNGGMDQIGAYCDFYIHQARYAFRLIAEKRSDEFLWAGWDEGTESLFEIGC